MCGKPTSDATGLVEAFRAGELSPVDVLNGQFDHIDVVNPQIDAFAYLVPREELLAAAEQCRVRYREHRPLSCLDGVVVALKDNIDSAAMPCECGFTGFRGRVAGRDAAIVAGIKRAGALVIGKTRMWELATDAPDAGHLPRVKNPWRLELSPGGSSSGSAAAVAAGLAPIALGTDTGGSIRTPGSVTGIAGFKPSRGLLSVDGVQPVSWSLDHVGPMARSARDCALFLSAVGPSFASVESRRKSRVLVPRAWIAGSPGVQPETLAAFTEAVAVLRDGLGFDVVDFDGVPFDLVAAAFEVIFDVEAASYLGRMLPDVCGLMNPSLVHSLELGRAISSRQYTDALRFAGLLQNQLEAVMGGDGIIALPTRHTTAVAPSAEAGSGPWQAADSFRTAFNLTGQPAITVPCGFDGEGLPVGLQLVARLGMDRELLAVAQSYQGVAGWHEARPALPAALDLTLTTADLGA